MLVNIPALEDMDFVKEIAKNDWMAGSSPEWYFNRGYDAFSTIIRECQRARIKQPKRLLDFGCGHGCIARLLKAHFSEAIIVGQDVNPEWLAWCEEKLAIETVLSEDRIIDVKLPQNNYDIIWAGSVFSHIPEYAAIHLLSEMLNALTEDGILVFSTAGQIMRNGYEAGKIRFLDDSDIVRMNEEFDEGKYAFSVYNTGNYKEWGHSLFSYRWLFKQSQKQGWHIAGFSEGGWGMVQDIYAMRKNITKARWPA